jgi:hypothetical protein
VMECRRPFTRRNGNRMTLPGCRASTTCPWRQRCSPRRHVLPARAQSAWQIGETRTARTCRPRRTTPPTR